MWWQYFGRTFFRLKSPATIKTASRCFLRVDNIIQLVQHPHDVGVGWNISSSPEHSCKLSRQINGLHLIMMYSRSEEHPKQNYVYIHTPPSVSHYVDLTSILLTRLLCPVLEVNREVTVAKSGTERSIHVSVKKKKLQTLIYQRKVILAFSSSTLFSKVWTLARRLMKSEEWCCLASMQHQYGDRGNMFQLTFSPSTIFDSFMVSDCEVAVLEFDITPKQKCVQANGFAGAHSVI